MKNLQLTINREIRQYGLMFTLSLFCLGLLLIRAKITQSIFLFFLIWNLFLAYTPLAVSSLLINNITLVQKRRYLLPLLACWLFLLPNAPYLITDFIHLNKDNAIPVWFDILLIASFTLTGLLFGLASMHNVYKIVLVKTSATAAKIIMLFICGLCGFGIYLGRFLRYNSWDILQKPISLGIDIFSSLFASETYRAAWGITLGFGMLQYLLFSIYNEFKQ
ncbi:MAG: DUF1361 domain-containing protein [Bacteroidota bacterium]